MSGELPSLSFVLIGAGRVGTAVSLLLKRSGATPVGVSSRTTGSAEEAARLLGTDAFDHRNELPEADAVLLGAGDEGISEIAQVLATSIKPDVYVCHFAGSLGTGPLQPISEAGARSCALHPVQACPSVEAGVKRLPGSVWGATCSEDAFVWASDLIKRLDGRVVRVAEDDRPVWHAAAVSVSNGIAALMSVGEGMLSAIGIAEPHDVLGPLASGTVDNAREGGGGGATLTGPVVRNELGALLRHLEELRRVDKELTEEYVSVASLIVRAAVRSGRLSREAGDRMLEELT
jgi:predicted short-subunit dehydrogenase-like oxidoreductase (DUF2520 family)